MGGRKEDRKEGMKGGGVKGEGRKKHQFLIFARSPTSGLGNCLLLRMSKNFS